jgi:predicted transposase/invertase (TIGR01784 family)
MGHDQLFKEVLQAHLQAFLELFFPDVAARLDFNSLHFFDKEVFTDSPEGSRREADVVAALETHEGAQELVLVHIEVQVEPRKVIAQRMFEYYVLLRRRHLSPVFPIVLYLRGGKGLSEEEYRETLFGREQLRFRYMSIGLAKLESEEYLEKSPLAAALAALMNRARAPDRLKLRADMLRQIAESRLDDAQQFLLVNVVETYFELDVEETERFRQFLSTKGYRKVEKMQVTWADKMMEQGREQGLKAGVIEGKRETLLRQLIAKFGSVSEEARSRVQALESAAELDAYLELVLKAESIDDMGL